MFRIRGKSNYCCRVYSLLIAWKSSLANAALLAMVSIAQTDHNPYQSSFRSIQKGKGHLKRTNEDLICSPPTVLTPVRNGHAGNLEEARLRGTLLSYIDKALTGLAKVTIRLASTSILSKLCSLFVAKGRSQRLCRSSRTIQGRRPGSRCTVY